MDNKEGEEKNPTSFLHFEGLQPCCKKAESGFLPRSAAGVQLVITATESGDYSGLLFWLRSVPSALPPPQPSIKPASHFGLCKNKFKPRHPQGQRQIRADAQHKPMQKDVLFCSVELVYSQRSGYYKECNLMA